MLLKKWRDDAAKLRCDSLRQATITSFFTSSVGPSPVCAVLPAAAAATPTIVPASVPTAVFSATAPTATTATVLSAETLALCQRRRQEGYDLPDADYLKWLQTASD